MVQKWICFLVWVLFLVLGELQGGAVKGIKLEELVAPDGIAVSGERIYITEETSLYIYDRDSLNLIKKVGKPGEGPGEFMLNVMNGYERLILDVRPSGLMANSMGKITFLDMKDGAFVKEIKVSPPHNYIFRLGSGFVGQAMDREKDLQYRSVNLYDSKVKKVKQLMRVRHHFQIQEGLRLFEAALRYAVLGDRVYVTWDKDFLIRVFDKEGKDMGSIKHEYTPVKISQKDKDNVENFLRTNRKYKPLFERFQIKLIFPDYYPAIDNILTDGDKLYIVTYGLSGEYTEGLLLDQAGKLVKRVKLPLIGRREFELNPYTIADHKFYQLVEDGDEHWQLKVSPIR